MTDASDLDERLARLAARRASASSPRDDGTRVAPERRKRRRHAAAAGRVFAAGLSTSGFLAIVTALAAQQPASGVTKVASAPPRGPLTSPLGSTSLPPTTKSKVVVKTVHHTVFVDTYGRTVAPPLVPATAGTSTAHSTTPHSVATPTAHPAVGRPAPVSSSPPPTKAPTTSPATPHTSPPVTVHTPPPPPPPPHCSGSKCP